MPQPPARRQDDARAWRKASWGTCPLRKLLRQPGASSWTYQPTSRSIVPRLCGAQVSWSPPARLPWRPRTKPRPRCTQPLGMPPAGLKGPKPVPGGLDLCVSMQEEMKQVVMCPSRFCGRGSGLYTNAQRQLRFLFPAGCAGVTPGVCTVCLRESARARERESCMYMYHSGRHAGTHVCAGSPTRAHRHQMPRRWFLLKSYRRCKNPPGNDVPATRLDQIIGAILLHCAGVQP